MGVGGAVLAQAPFTIVRPADNSRVREKVRILIPKDSVPPGGYVGVFLNGKLLEAVVPPIEGKYRVYSLDTKGRGIPDTPAGKTDKLELVLYTDYNEQARVVDRSSVDVRIGNNANIPIPNKGLTLRYKFNPGTEMIYRLDQQVQTSSITEAQKNKGGTAAQFDTDGESIRLLYAVDNTYGNGDVLLRLQALPTKGKDYADLTTTQSNGQQRYFANQMAPLYMRISSTGFEQFSALPPSVGLFENNAGGADPLSLYAAFPLPTLPSKPVRPGDSWQSRFQRGKLDLNKYPNISTIVDKQPARGEFIGVEWEHGHPCAKLRNVIEASDADTTDTSDTPGANGDKIEKDKVSLTETIWFALDSHKVLKIIRDTTIDQKTQVSTGGFPGMGGPPSGFGAPGFPKGGAAGGGVGGKQMTPGPQSFRQKPGGGMMPGAQGAPGFPGRPGGAMGGGQMGGGMGGQSMTPTFIRIRMLQTFTLEM